MAGNKLLHKIPTMGDQKSHFPLFIIYIQASSVIGRKKILSFKPTSSDAKTKITAPIDDFHKKKKSERRKMSSYFAETSSFCFH